MQHLFQLYILSVCVCVCVCVCVVVKICPKPKKKEAKKGKNICISLFALLQWKPVIG
jgi:hypothetical protein